MATLEKIRSKSVLLLVIIGAALIAFIIGDFFTSGRTFFGTGTTVAKAGDQKIDVQEFQRRMELANQQYQQSGQKIDQAVLQQNVLNAMVGEKLFQEELSKLGLRVTDAELSDMMLGANSYYFDQLVRQQFQVENAATLHDMAFNPVKYGLDESTAVQLQQIWMNLENQMEQQLLQQKFMNLFAGSITANELDAKALYDDGIATSSVAYVVKPYSSLSDEEYPVSSDEIRKAWNEEKEQYAIPEQMRQVSYISVDIAPSKDDLTAAEQAVEEAIVALNEQPETEGVSGKNEFVVNRQKTTSAAIRDAQIKRFVDSASVGSANLVSRIGNDFTLAKLIGKSSEIDSINVDMFVIHDTRSAADSIIKQLNAGTMTFDALQELETADQIQSGMQLSLLDPQLAQVKNALSTAPTGRYFTPDTISPQNIVITKVNSRTNPVTVYDIAVIGYTAEPSNATINQLQADLQAYINANNNATDFNQKASESNYQAFPAMVNASSAQISSIPDTRSAVSWTMNAKKGAVSPIFGDETTGRFLVIALNDIYDNYIPAHNPQINMMLVNKVRNDKKATAMIDQYQGKANDLAGYAELMDSRVDTASVNFGQISLYTPGVGSPEVVAYITSSEPGKLMGPVQGASGVVVFDVIAVDNQGRPYNYQESAAVFDRTRGASVLSNNLQGVLLGNNKVQNNLLKFFRD